MLECYTSHQLCRASSFSLSRNKVFDACCVKKRCSSSHTILESPESKRNHLANTFKVLLWILPNPFRSGDSGKAFSSQHVLKCSKWTSFAQLCLRIFVVYTLRAELLRLASALLFASSNYRDTNLANWSAENT